MPNYKMGWTGVSMSDLYFMYHECIIISSLYGELQCLEMFYVQELWTSTPQYSWKIDNPALTVAASIRQGN